jgi:hypothetical protein
MDSVASPTAPGVWTIEATEGITLGAIEQRPEGVVVVPSAGSQLTDFDVPPCASLKAALAGAVDPDAFGTGMSDRARQIQIRAAAPCDGQPGREGLAPGGLPGCCLM